MPTRRKSGIRRGRRHHFLIDGARVAMYEAIWDKIYEETFRMLEDKEQRQRFERLAADLFRGLAEQMERKLSENIPSK